MKTKRVLHIAVLCTGFFMITKFAFYASSLFTRSTILKKGDVYKTLFRGDVFDNMNTDEKYANWVVVMAVNDGYFDFFSNWLWYFRAHKLPVPVVVIAEDEPVLKKLSLFSYGRLTVERGINTADIKEAVPFDNLRFGKIVNERPRHILKYLETGKNVLYSDADTVWLKDPFLYFIGDYDIWAQQDRQDICTGFFAIRSNSRTVKLMKDWRDYLKRYSPRSNQKGFNELNMSNVRISRLSMNTFPSGDIHFAAKGNNNHSEVVIVHNNYIVGHDKKLERFKQFHLWYNNTK